MGNFSYRLMILTATKMMKMILMTTMMRRKKRNVQRKVKASIRKGRRGSVDSLQTSSMMMLMSMTMKTKKMITDMTTRVISVLIPMKEKKPNAT